MNRTKRYGFYSVFWETVQISPWKFGIEYTASMLNGVLLALTAVATGNLFSSIMEYARGSILIWSVLVSILAVTAITILSEILSGISAYYGEVYYDLMMKDAIKTVNAKVSGLPCIKFEDPMQLNQISSAYQGAANARQIVNVIMDALTFYCPYFLVYGVYLYTLRPVLLMIFPLVIVPSVVGQIIKTKFSVDEEEESAPLRRKLDSYTRYVGDREFAKETRVLGATSYFLDRIKKTCGQLRAVSLKAKNKSWGVDLAVAMLNLFGYGSVIYLLISSIFSGYIEVASFAAVFATIGMLIDMEKELFAGRFSEIAECYGDVKQYLDFMNLPDIEFTGEKLSKIHEIRLEHVSFCYPCTDAGVAPAVQNVDLVLRSGESLAIVGDNGSGKTTLTKMLLGLYLPTDGTIYYEGIPYTKINTSSIWKNSTAVFQMFKKYHMTLRDNIALCDTDNSPEIQNAMEKAKLDERFFPEELETMLSKEFGGIDMSGGQWQKIAIARGIFHMGDLVVLDEPTASIDPVNEYQLYNCFLDMIKDHIGILVTHRLGLAKCCTRIALMQHGRIVNLGTHEELMETCSDYREMWETQAEKMK